VVAGALRGTERISVLVALDLNHQLHLIVHRRDCVGHAEIGALDGDHGIGATDIFFVHRGVRAVKGVHGKRYRLGDAVQGQVAVQRREFVALEGGAGRFEGDGRKLGGVKEVFVAQVVLEFIQTGVDRVRVETFLAARSSTMLPVVLLNRPRWVEKPMWPISKLGKVWVESMV